MVHFSPPGLSVYSVDGLVTDSRLCTHVHILPCSEMSSSDGSSNRQQSPLCHSELPQLPFQRSACLGKVPPQCCCHLHTRAHTCAHTRTHHMPHQVAAWPANTGCLLGASWDGPQLQFAAHSIPPWPLSVRTPPGCPQSATDQQLMSRQTCSKPRPPGPAPPPPPHTHTPAEG